MCFCLSLVCFFHFPHQNWLVSRDRSQKARGPPPLFSFINHHHHHQAIHNTYPLNPPPPAIHTVIHPPLLPPPILNLTPQSINATTPDPPPPPPTVTPLLLRPRPHPQGSATPRAGRIRETSPSRGLPGVVFFGGSVDMMVIYVLYVGM